MENRTCAGPGCQHELAPGSRADQRFCSQACRLRAFRTRHRKNRLRSYYPETARSIGNQSLTELYDRARVPDWDGIEAGHVDDDQLELDGDEQDQDDEPGIIGGDAYPDRDDYDPNAAWHERQQLVEAVEVVQARYDALLRPYRLALLRNPGVKPVAMARLEASRDVEIRDLYRAHERAEALEDAVRQAPQRAVQAAERQQAEAALTAFGRDLPGGSRRYQAPLWTGRDIGDIATW